MIWLKQLIRVAKLRRELKELKQELEAWKRTSRHWHKEYRKLKGDKA